MGFFIELILECIGDIGIGLAGAEKQKRKEMFEEMKEYLREKLRRWMKK